MCKVEKCESLQGLPISPPWESVGESKAKAMGDTLHPWHLPVVLWLSQDLPISADSWRNFVTWRNF